MIDQVIDLASLEFWLILAAAAFVLAPLRPAHWRKAVFAAINVGFLALLVGHVTVPILLTVGAAYLLLRGIAGRHRNAFGAFAAVTIVSLFLIHKLTVASTLSGFGPIADVLSIVGFSYVALRAIEVFRAVYERAQSPPDLLSLTNYLLPFHMLAAGPIQAYDDFAAQIDQPRSPLTTADVVAATERITLGLFKKFVLAYAIQKIFLTDFTADGLYFFVEVQIFFLWLYLDFSAYADIAVGIGRLLGISTPENFNKPYLARSAIDFWDRWHISLSMFIRRNIFIPLQVNMSRRFGGKHPLFIASGAFIVAFLLCGLWHGVTVNFVLWGAIHAVALVIANLWREFLKRNFGPTFVRKYMKSRPIKWIARFITYQYVAFSLVVLFL